jgi:hypothetical protein
MKALILYVVFLCIGAVGSTAIGYYVEINSSPAMSLIVFLTLFFVNFVVSWLAVVLVMDGSLRDVGGMEGQLEAEKIGRAGAATAQGAHA